MTKVLFLVELSGGKVKKSSAEAASYASQTAQLLGGDAIGIALGTAGKNELSNLGNYGVKKVLHDSNVIFDNFDSGLYSKAISQISSQTAANIVIFSGSLTGKSIAPRVAVRLDAGIVSGAVSLPDLSQGFVVKKSAFSGKAFAFVKIDSDNKVISFVPNSIGVIKSSGEAIVETLQLSVDDSKIKIKEVVRQSGDVAPLPEAELVVSAGRGMKGPENWKIVEDLAQVLNATTACSRPVADVHWRPHHEHVGQTGVAIRPNLYIAIGISGAIQHLAGVNQSKVIVVINKDPEAPFFKAADYGIVGDLFEVVPKLTEAFRKFKANLN